MSLLNQQPKLRVEDFKADQIWLGKLFNNLNPFIEAVFNIINGNIDFSTNINSITNVYNINNFQVFNISWPFNNTPQDLRIIQALKGSTQTPTLLMAAWSYDQSSKSISVTNLLEVTSSGNIPVTSLMRFTLRVTV